MRVKDLKKKSNNRIDTSYLQSLGIQTYGQDNLYPQTLKILLLQALQDPNAQTVSLTLSKETDSVRLLYRNMW